MSNQKSKFSDAAAIVGNTLLVAVPLSGFIYLVIAALAGCWLPYKWSETAQFFFSVAVVLSLFVGGGVADNAHERHSN